MERIKIALERARIQRGEQQEPALVPAIGANAAVELHVATQVTPWRTPVFPVSVERLVSARILVPGQSGALAAPYKLLRTQVLRRMEQLGATTLAIISPRANDGKTLTAINLAISLSSDPNRTTLLVDFDLRNPQLAERFGVEPEVGVESCLQDRAPVERSLVRPEGYDRLTLLPARQSVDQSSELLGSSRAGELVSEVRDRYTNRVVLFDMAPVLEADDALAFSRHMQAALLVVTEGRTRREDVTRTLDLLRDTPIVGTVLNGSREQASRAY
jgi:Mrp family chromosome partitioning ATPase